MSHDKHDHYQVSLKALITNDEGEVLLLKAQPGGSYDGYYDLPGGRISISEFSTPFDTILRREIVEEVGEIDIEILPKPVAVGRHLLSAEYTADRHEHRVLYIFFEVRFHGGTITISDEHSAYTWVRLDSIDRSRYFISGIWEAIEMYLKRSS